MKVIKIGNWYKLEVPNKNPIWLGKVSDGVFIFRRNFKKDQVFHTADVGAICLNKELLLRLRKDGITMTKYNYSNVGKNGNAIKHSYNISVDEWMTCGVNYHNPVFPYDNQKKLMKGVFQGVAVKNTLKDFKKEEKQSTL